MKNIKYELHTVDLQDFFIPINEIKSELYKVSAKNAEEAIHKLTSNPSKFSKVRSVHLIETSPNCVFSDKNINGAQRWNRTTDTRIFSPLLYRLSYLGNKKSEIIF